MKVTTTELDYWLALKLHYRQTLLLLFSLAVVVGLTAVLLRENWDMSLEVAWSIAAGAIAGVVFYFFVFLRLWNKRIFKQQANLNMPYELEWDEQSVRMRNELGESNIPWGTFVRYKENERVILMYYSDVLYNLVPKSAFTGEQQIEDFMQRLTQGVTKKL